jgi:hypothetical protein
MPRWSPFEPYFWSLVDKSGDCWIWKGNRYGNGYGRVHYKGKRQPAHRVACALAGVPIPDGLLGCHSCDNKLCVRPSHIFLGTQVDNMQDWTKKGKNKLISDPSLLKRGNEHWTRIPEYAPAIEEMAEKRREEFRTGRREIIRGEGGRIVGTRMKNAPS